MVETYLPSMAMAPPSLASSCHPLSFNREDKFVSSSRRASAQAISLNMPPRKGGLTQKSGEGQKGSGGRGRILKKEQPSNEALGILHLMGALNIWVDTNTYASLLQGCTHTNAMTEGLRVHAHMTKTGFEPGLFLENNLVAMYVKCGNVGNARQVFDKMQVRDKVSWTAMIAGYAENGMAEEALALYCQMRKAGMKPNHFTFVSILRACACLEALEPGKQVHAWIIKKGYGVNVYLGSALVDLYVDCGQLVRARQVFDEMSERDVVCWTAIITGYSQQRHEKEALALFHQMQIAGTKPNDFTLPSVLRACAGVGDLELGKGVHAYSIKLGVECDVFVGSALVDMYGKCGCVVDARQVFDEMPQRDTALWNAMISGYVQHGCSEQALILLHQMQFAGMKPDELILINVMNACES